MQEFNPVNTLELILVDAQLGKVPVSKFFEELAIAKVYVLIDKDPGPSGNWNNDISLLVLHNQAQIPVIAMFTTPERSLGWPEKFSSFKYGLFVDFKWLLNGIAQGVGIVLNPGSKVGVELSPDKVGVIKRNLLGAK